MDCKYIKADTVLPYSSALYSPIILTKKLTMIGQKFAILFFVKTYGELQKIREIAVGQSISLGGVSISGSIALLFITKSGPALVGMTNFSSMGSGVTICHSGIFNPDTTGGLANFDLKIENL